RAKLASRRPFQRLARKKCPSRATSDKHRLLILMPNALISFPSANRAQPNLPLEPVALREALRRQAAGFGAVADPFIQLGPRHGERAPCRVAPAEPVGDRKDFC